VHVPVELVGQALCLRLGGGADDALGKVYLGEELRGVWKYGAEPDTGSSRTSIGSVGDGHLVADVEGIAIAYQPNGAGHLIVSSQGNSTYAVYERGSGRWVRSFSVAGYGNVDRASGTDGLDVSTAGVGPAFPNGVLIVHDEDNTGANTSNYKYVDLAQILG
jgi:3-phytase